MFPDQAWDAATRNWQPGGSFLAPLPTPAHGPADGTLIQLPCINQEWVLLLMGCVTQLQNPAIWGDSLADTIRDQVLSWVTQLLELLWSGMDVPCCNVQLRLQDCVLQSSVDGGSHWTDVSGWAANFCTCASACIVPPVPPFPPGQLVNQHACNIAGFIATKVIELMLDKIVAYVGVSNQQVQFATDVLASIGFAFPITYAASLAFQDWYRNVTGQVLSEVTAVRDDPTFWSEVTCAIYAAIRVRGYVDATNFAAVEANLSAISYTYPWAVVAVATFWNDLGLTNVQAMQNVGALDVVDCTACNVAWCAYFDFTAGQMGWITAAGGCSTYVPGSGWHAVGCGITGVIECAIQLDMGANYPITKIDVLFATNQGATSGRPHLVAVESTPGTAVCYTSIPEPIQDPTPAWQSGNVPCTGRYIVVNMDTASAGGGYLTIVAVQVHGTGINPFGADNCIH